MRPISQVHPSPAHPASNAPHWAKIENAARTGGDAASADGARVPPAALEHLYGAQPEASVLLSSQEAQQALKVLDQQGLPPPTIEAMGAVKKHLDGQPVYRGLVHQSAQALVGQNTPPSQDAWQAALGSLPSPGAHTSSGRRAVAQNMVALVFLVMLEAQRSAYAEKREALRAVKMYSGMLEDLNGWVARVVVPAQRSLNSRAKIAQDKDLLAKRGSLRASDRQERLEETLVMPKEVDTQWGVIDEATGKISLRGLHDDAAQVTRVDQLELSQLVSQTEQWRAVLQNNQSRQSTEFQRIDNAMSSTWNMLSAFIKAAQDGASASIRNGLG